MDDISEEEGEEVLELARLREKSCEAGLEYRAASSAALATKRELTAMLQRDSLPEQEYHALSHQLLSEAAEVKRLWADYNAALHPVDNWRRDDDEDSQKTADIYWALDVVAHEVTKGVTAY